MSPRWSGRTGISILLLVYLLLGQTFVESVPPWEAPDEPWHLVYSEALAAGRLPTEAETYEHHHPPLYYLWPALTLRVAGIAAVPRSVDNYRYPFAAAAYLHPEDESAHAPLRLVRTLSGMLGALAVALTWSAARLAARGSERRDAIAWTAAGVAALIPQFGFIAHSISNDTLATVWGAWLTYWGLRWLRWADAAGSGAGEAPARARRRERNRIATALGLGAGLGLLTKLNLLALWPAVAIVVAMGGVLLRRGDSRASRAEVVADARPTAIRRAVLTLLPAAILVALLAFGLVAGASAIWPSIGDNLASTLLDRGEAREELSGATYLVDQSRRMVDSLWGRYGWFNLPAPEPQRRWMGLLALLALLGLPFAFRRALRAERACILYAFAICALALTAGLRNVMVDPQPQARLLFPALPAFSLLLAWGSSAYPGLPTRRPGAAPDRSFAPSLVALLLCGSLVLTSLDATRRLLPRAFAPSRMPPPMLDTRMLPSAWKIAARLDSSGGGGQAAQSFVAREAGLRAIEVPVIVADGEGTLLARLYEGEHQDIPASREPLGETVTPLRELGRPDIERERLGPLADTSWIRVEHPPRPDSAGRTYTLVLRLEGEGRAWLWGASDGDDYPEGLLTVDGSEETDLVFTTLR